MYLLYQYHLRCNKRESIRPIYYVRRSPLFHIPATLLIMQEARKRRCIFTVIKIWSLSTYSTAITECVFYAEKIQGFLRSEFWYIRSSTNVFALIRMPPHSLPRKVFSITVFLTNISITTINMIFWLNNSPISSDHLHIAKRTNFWKEPEVHIYKVGGIPVNFFLFLRRFRMFRFLGEKREPVTAESSRGYPHRMDFYFAFYALSFYRWWVTLCNNWL